MTIKILPNRNPSGVDILMRMQSHLRKLGRCIAVAAPLIALASCVHTPAEPQAGTLDKVITTITPVQGLIRPLLPPAVDCVSIIGPGEAVHAHQATPAEIAQARTADFALAVGLGIDSATLDAISKTLARSGTLIIFAEVVGATSNHTDDGHDHAAGHQCTAAETHLWLDPILAAAFAEHAAAALAQAAADNNQPDLATDIRARAQTWVARIHAVDDQYRQRLAPFAGRTILTTHPAFGLLLERYGLHEKSFSPTSPHSAPSPAQLAEAVLFARDQHASAVFTEPQAPRGIAETVARRTGLPLGTLDPLGDGDWEAMMLANLDALEAALSAGAAKTPGIVP